MGVTVACDYCRATIDTASDDALIVSVHRRVDEDEWEDDEFITGGTDVFRFCSQAHLAAFMERNPLPPPRSGEDESFGGTFSCLLAVVYGLAFIALTVGSVYGLYLFVVDVF